MDQGHRLTIALPNAFGGGPHSVEAALALLTACPDGSAVDLVLDRIGWVCPYGAAMLLAACRYLAVRSRRPVLVRGLIVGVHAYLRRIDFFTAYPDVVVTTDGFQAADDWARSAASSNVLELIPVITLDDVFVVAHRARSILTCWLGHSVDVDRVVSLLAEACANVVDHSRDAGVVAIQKYERSGYVDVEIGIADIGQGVRRSLRAAHGDVAATCAGYIQQAFGGLSSRPGGRGGLGLDAIRRIAVTSGGGIYLRSETGCFWDGLGGTGVRDGLAWFPGTQLAVTFRGGR